jgi:tRNA A-37 threonylcarbamoyl transferase component Bud32
LKDRCAPAVRWLALSGPPPDGLAEALLGDPGTEVQLEALIASPSRRFEPAPAASRTAVEREALPESVGGRLDPAPAAAPWAVQREALTERPGGRRPQRAVLASGEVLFVKRFSARRACRRLQQAFARLALWEAARREWRALRRLAAAGVPVPAPRALGRLRGGDLVLVTSFLAGPTLGAAVASGARGGALAEAVGGLVARLHAAGLVHGDLHRGNVLLAAQGPTLVELAAARRSRGRRARRRDLAGIDHSLAGRLPLVDRLRLRAAALGHGPPFPATTRRELRAVGRLSRRLALAHARGRMRRARRPGRRFARAEVDALRGLRVRGLAQEALAAAVAPPPGAKRARRRLRWVEGSGRRLRWAQVCGRRLVVKEFTTGLRGALADLARGSPARRAWLAGHGLAALGIGCAAPLAFLERGRLGLVRRSLLVLEDLCPSLPADAPGPELGADERVGALLRLALALHGRGADHRDFMASNVLLARRGHGLATRLVDLEDVRFPRRLRDAARVRALAQLNASLPDWVPDALRRRAFRRYAAWLPFRAPQARVLARIVARSLARRHHWSGRAREPDRGLGDATRGARRAEGGPRGPGPPPPAHDAEMLIQRNELEEPGMRPPLPSS